MKKIFSSKVVWFNIISTLLEVAVVIEGLMPAKYLVYTTAVKSILNIFLRIYFTNKPLTAFAAKQEPLPPTFHGDEIE